MSDLATHPAYLRYQYGDAEQLRIRQESHRLYSERPNAAFFEWIVDRLAPAPGHVVLDAGCGPGTYHALLHLRRTRVVAFDASPGMAREAQGQATREGLAAAILQADVQATPVKDGACDRVLAAHMLYHVPDRAKALGELRRALRPGGRVMLVTGAGSVSRLHEVHRRAARAIGYSPTDGPGARFSLAHLDLVREVFPTAERHVFPNAFRFPTAEAVMRYYASGPVNQVRERQADGGHRRRLLPMVEAEVRTIVEREGVFREEKDNGCFVADV
jgi:SAM-dependent methyltransferase